MMYYENGEVFYCEWKNNKPHGIGMRMKNKTKILEIWENGEAIVEGM